ncbi:MAG TPA: hypothetical protein VFL34_05215 [Candidatus Sulfotelmatobacter sp.]|nr:hypothetical protein [Candidatus Sulfotelmatobacter sp.]
MLKVKRCICSALLVVVTVAPALAGTKTASDIKAPAESASEPAAPPAGGANPTIGSGGNPNITALLGVLVMKGVLSASEGNAIRNAAPEAELQLLVEALARKGVVSAADMPAVRTPSPQVNAAVAVAVPAAASAAQATTPKETKPSGPAVVAAIVPLRVLPIDPPVKDGLRAAFTLGPVKMTPYGFLKATAVYDTSNPNGDDMPFPGLFLSSTSILNTGPTKNPEFHLKARSARIGANFEFPDMASRLTLTGRIEGDYEGNFSEVDNRDVSSIRSSMFSFRQAWARLDYAAGERTDIYFEGGQDWTLFGSSALPNLLETTALGYWYGDIYERSPQFQFGLVQKLGGSRNLKLAPTFAIMMPSTGQIEKLGTLGLQGQIAQAEREGADSGRPEFEGRLMAQFQLDKAPGVAPAQIFWSGFRAKRTSIVTSDQMGTAPGAYAAAFPNGFTASSPMYGNQVGLQLPTRWATLVASAYFGGDLRFFFGGQVNSFYTDIGGLTNPITFKSVDGGPLAAAGAPTLATNAAGQVVVAPEKPIRAFGGFVNLGLPLSRWFKADPKGHNAGWQLYLHMGKDQVVHNELTNPNAGAAANVLSPLPLLMGKLTAATLYYKVNPYVTFGFEESIYATRLVPGATYTIAGKPSNEWQDHRSEFGPIFTF